MVTHVSLRSRSNYIPHDDVRVPNFNETIFKNTKPDKPLVVGECECIAGWVGERDEQSAVLFDEAD